MPTAVVHDGIVDRVARAFFSIKFDFFWFLRVYSYILKTSEGCVAHSIP